MKRIFGILLLILGFLLTLLGLLFKLESWELANEMLISGLVMGIAAGMLLLSKARLASENGKFRTPVLMIATGIGLTVLGAVSILESWGYSSEMLMLGNVLQVIGAAVLIYKVLSGRKSKIS